MELASVHGVGGVGCNTAVHPVRTHCTITVVCKKDFSAGCFPGFNGKNEAILLLSALHGAACTLCSS